jgi:hypothetical protein
LIFLKLFCWGGWYLILQQQPNTLTKYLHIWIQLFQSNILSMSLPYNPFH